MTTRHCDDCGHAGDEGGSTTESYCGACGATVPYPAEDRCQVCDATNCMLIACPECGGRYWEQDECSETPNVGGEARLAAHQPSHTTTATPQGVASTDQLGV